MRKKALGYMISLVLLVLLLMLFIQHVRDIMGPEKEYAGPPDPQRIPINITLTWSDDPATSQTITWQTKKSFQGLIRFTREKDDNPFLFQFPVTRKVEAEKVRSLTGETLYLYSVTLTELDPDTKYFYKLGDGYRWTREGFFKTGNPEGPFQFLIFGDSQSYDDYATWNRTLRVAVKLNPLAKFFINMGDLVDRGDRLQEWDHWLMAGQNIMDHLSVMPIRGNHDSYKPYWLSFFRLPLNGPPGLKGLTYSFDYGSAHFIMLDDLSENNSELLASQKKWLQRDLVGTAKPWKFVFFHRPFYSNVSGRANNYLRQAYEHILNSNQVDLVFNGHDHVLVRTFPIINGKIAKESDKGTIYYLTGRSGTKKYKKATQSSWDQFFYNPVHQPNFISVQVTESELKITACDQDGSIIDVFSMPQKP